VVAKLLAPAEGLGQGFRSIRHLLPAHLHEKIYLFSHPAPAALLGSFNPSGNSPEDPIVIRAIGDQDRGHNYLAEIKEPAVVANLRRHILSLAANRRHMLGLFANGDLTTDRLRIFYYPRADISLVSRLLSDQKYERVRIAVSHFSDGHLVRLLARLARSGCEVEVLAHDAPERVRPRIEKFAKASGISFVRYAHPQRLPMHSKFILLSAPGFQRVIFGSMNLTRSSQLLNHEILVAADEAPDIYQTFNARFEHMMAETEAFRNSGGAHNGRSH
jgi:phosphatidylserine/phosphatidylglycerophosphate/cardiolipin synthase-like enzyme